MLSISRILKPFVGESYILMMRYVSQNARVIIVPEVDDTVLRGLEDGSMTPRKHPGKVPRECIEFDDRLLEAMKIVLKDTIVKNLLVDAEKLCQYLKARHPPISPFGYNEMKRDCYSDVLHRMKLDPDNLDEISAARIGKSVDKGVNILMKQRIYNWKPINYTSYVGKQYLINRMIAEFSALNRIFWEITIRNPNFHPTSLFDFGSGVGTVTWAAQKHWSDSIKECYNVDLSPEMNEIADLLLRGGDEKGTLPIPQVYYRQFLSAGSQPKYNLVVCSYTLFELPSAEIRLKILLNLWNKTQDFLVIVEQGTTHGCKLILEARDFLLDFTKSNDKSSDIHVFAPCPHEVSCPLQKISETPCRFKASYIKPPIGRNKMICNEYYSFVILKKGKKSENDEQWPRVLKPATRKGGVVRCRLCCADGKLRFFNFHKKKHGKNTTQMARSSHSCDRLPLHFREMCLDFDEDIDDAELSQTLLTNEDFSDDESDDELKPDFK